MTDASPAPSTPAAIRPVGEVVAPALEISGLSFGYGGAPVLVDVALAIGSGEFLVLLGPNGAGKTTLFSLVTRLYDRRVGAIRIDGFDVREEPRRALSRLGVVFQQPTLDLDLTVRQNLAYHAALHGLPPALARERMAAQLERLGIADLRGTRVRHLSGGQRRRVEIARAFLHAPRLLLFDEPTVGLDIKSRLGIVEHVHRLAAEEGVAVLWATHLIDEVHDGDTVVVMDKGRVRAHGSVGDVVREAGAASIGAAYRTLTEGGKA
jgi:ABC-2 type transport system ATP-binding protein